LNSYHGPLQKHSHKDHLFYLLNIAYDQDFLDQ
jgi:hypothetical protein